MTELKAINYTITLLACVQPPLPSKIIHYCCHVGGFGEKYLIVLTINMATLSRGGKPRIDHTDKNYTKVGNLRGSQWGSGFYGYRLNFWLFYDYRLIFFSYG